MTKILQDPRVAFRGDDPGKWLRAAAADLAEERKRGQERQRRALHQYTTTPYLEVTVHQVRHNPPLWRMQTVRPVVEGGELVTVQEQDRTFLRSEMVLAVARELLKHGYAPDWETAKQRVLTLQVMEVGLIKLLDSENYAGERRR